jgi:hypothetical protein
MYKREEVKAMMNSKQPYEAPKVTRHGTVEELTQNTGSPDATDVPMGTPVTSGPLLGSNY